MVSLNWLLLFCFFFVNTRFTDCKKSFVMKSLEMCEKNYDYPITFSVSSRIENGEQYMNVTAVLNVPFGQNQSMNTTFEYSPNGDNFIPLFKFARSNICDFLNKDLGQFWIEIQKQLAVPPRTCPVPVGRYNLRNYQLPLAKLNFPVPSGLIRTVLYIVETKTRKVVSCLYSTMEVSD